MSESEPPRATGSDADTQVETTSAARRIARAEATERSVVLPVYDESPDTLTRLVEQLREAAWDEVVVCADRPDAAMRETLSTAAESPDVRVSVCDDRRGKGGALADGLAVADGDVLGYVDADGAVPVDELVRLYRTVADGRASVAVGSRDAGTGARANQSRVRRGLGAVYRTLSGVLVDTPVADVQCGAKAFTHEVWEAVGDEVSETGFAFDTELVARAHRRGFEVQEVGIDWSEPGESTVRPVRDAPRMLSALFRIRRAFSSTTGAVDATTETPTTAPDATGVESPTSPVETLDVALVTAHPPTQGHLAEYGQHLAQSYRDRDDVRLTVLAPDDYSGGPDGTVRSLHDRNWEYEVRRVWTRDSVRGAGRLLSEIRDGGYDAVQFNAHMTYFGERNATRFLGLSLPPLASAVCNARVVTTLHDMLEVVADDVVDEDVGRLERVGAKVATQTLLCGDATTVTSAEYRDTILKGYRVDADAVHHVPHGTFGRAESDGRASRGRSAEGDTDADAGADPFRVMVFGHLGPTKDVDTVVTAVDRLADRRDDVTLVVAGDSHPQYPDYRERLEAEYADRPHVEFTGYVADEEMDAVWADASLLVMPYATCTGVSGVYQLAKSHATPVVAFDAPGMRNATVETGGDASFVNPGDPYALAAELARLADAPTERREMTRRNAAAAAEFTIDDTVHEMVDIMRGKSR